MLDKVLTYAIPLAAVVLSYVCGFFQNRLSVRRESRLARYNSFYVPFIRHLYLFHMDLVCFTDLSRESQTYFFNLVFDNIHHLGPCTQKLILLFYDAYLEAPTIDSRPSPRFKSRLDIDALFIKFGTHALSEALKLQRQLRLPRSEWEFDPDILLHVRTPIPTLKTSSDSVHSRK